MLRHLRIKNFGKVREAELDLSIGNIVILKGPNASGKSTVSQHIFDMLRGQFPGTALTIGQESGLYEGEFTTGEKFYYRYDDIEGERLILKDENGKPMNRTQAAKRVRELIGKNGHFNIDAYIAETAPGALRKMAAKLVDQDLTEVDKAIKDAEDARKEQGRDVKRCEGVWVDSISGFETMEEVEAAMELADRDEVVVSEVAQAIADVREKKANIKLSEDRIKRFDENIQNEDREIARIDNEIAEYERKVKALKEERKKAEDGKANIEKAKKKEEVELGKLPQVQDGEIEELEEKMRKAEETNKSIRTAKAIKKAKEEHEAAKTLYKKKDDAVTTAREEKVKKIASAKLPAGLSLNDEGHLVLSNGLPLHAASDAEKTICGLEIALEEIGELKYVAFDGSHLDGNNLVRVVKMIEDAGCQAVIEIAERDPNVKGLHIEIFEDWIK